MKFCINSGIVLLILLSLVVSAGISTGDIPPISVKNAHTTISTNFFADQQKGTVPFNVSFTSLSTGLCDHFEWSFGDGEASFEENPVHIYLEPGVYSVSLFVSGTAGSDKKTRIGYISAFEADIGPEYEQEPETSQRALEDAPLIIKNEEEEEEDPVKKLNDSLPTKVEQTVSVPISMESLVHADFSAVPFEGTAPLQVKFEEQSSGEIIKREWKFGDGLFSEMENPTHVYDIPGTYEVSFTVTGTDNEDTKTRSSYIVVHPDQSPPTLVPSQAPSPEPSPSFLNVHEPVMSNPIEESVNILTDTLTTSISPVPESDAIFVEPENENPSPESLDLSVQIMDTEHLTLVLPIVDFDFTPDSGTAPLKIQFSDTSTGDYETRFWDFDDGTNSTDSNPLHIFENPGEYHVTLTLISPVFEDGFSKSKKINIQASPKAPVADFTVSNTEGTAPLPIVCFDNSKGDITDWIWNFGDGKIVRGRNPTHTYILPGQYSITLTAKGPGGKDEIRKNSLINVLQSPDELEALFSADPVQGYIPMSVSFNDKSTGIITEWNWDFGDGTISSEQNPTHVYVHRGTYNVTLKVTGTDDVSIFTREDLINALKTPEPVRAGFFAFPMSGDAPLTVTFTDKSTGDIDRWNWSFGDGSLSDKQNPEHTYTKPGIYPVRLEVSGLGGRDIMEKSDQISILGSGISPEIIITAEPSKGTAPLTVSFEKTSTGNEVSSLWTFGEGNSSKEENPVYTYTNPGVYNVSLIIQDKQGQTRTITKNKFVNVTKPSPPPVASFACNKTEGYAPFTIKFTDLSQGEIDHWVWDFGDGISAKSQEATHTYNQSGIYQVTLMVEGPGGEDKYTNNQSITVNDYIPEITTSLTEKMPSAMPDETHQSENVEQETNETVISPTITEPTQITRVTEKSEEILIPNITVSVKTGPAPLLVNFSSTWAKEKGTYLWKFGDGTTSNEPEVIHSYEEPGTYSVHLIREYEGLTQEIISNNLINVTETVSIPMAFLSAEPVSGPAPLHVTFHSESSGTISEWLWDFGDSIQDTGETVTHTYTQPGTYSVSLQVQGPDSSSTELREDLITVGTSFSPPPQARFKTDKRTGYAPLTVQFTDQSLGKVSEWRWNFGDGTNSTERNPSHEFNETGIFSVSLSVLGPAGTNQVSRKGYIVVSPSPKPLVAGFSMNPSEGIAPLSVQFTDKSTGTINRYLWNFGDGVVTETRNPIHRYSTPGIYVVQLTVYGPSGISSADQLVTIGPTLKQTNKQDKNSHFFKSETKKQNLLNVSNTKLSGLSKPVADFIVNKKSGRTPLSVSCEDLSTGTIESWSWNFGDGSDSIEQNPVHTYVKPGIYTISLTVKGPYGVSNKKIRDAVNIS